MMVLVTYDVSTSTREGRARLRRVARACLDYGQRVQNSVFECSVDPAHFAVLKRRILDLIDAEQDSVRFYFLGKNWQRRIEHVGAKPSIDPDGPLIV
ncbi:MAG: CRISPR-associated endonuclease Cas2 [Planctomycetota bacterium]|nr:MAG: CRISPR-associated endonuclease Cas2 [Planctomycetota bacterium]